MINVERRGIWVALDGTDAVGKTLQLSDVKQAIRPYSFDPIVVVPEFSNCHIGKTITNMLGRDRFFSLSEDRSTPRSDTLALLTDMVYQFENVIEPTVMHSRGVALSDRGPASLISYQAVRLATYDSKDFTEGSAFSWVLSLVHDTRIRPDLTVVLQIGERVLQERVKQRGEPPLNAKELDFLLHVNTFMIEAASLTSSQCRVVDAEQSRSQVTDQLITHITSFVVEKTARNIPVNE